MKKKLIGYIIITAILLLTITLSIPMLNYVRRGHTYSNFLLTNDQNHVLINNTSFDFSAKYISEISFNSSI
ncbi:MAG: hypothetical protein FK731_09350, partial [Asgard group archaeon]|nr:hypothetical protein [Asgard group archaeon]